MGGHPLGALCWQELGAFSKLLLLTAVLLLAMHVFSLQNPCIGSVHLSVTSALLKCEQVC